MTSMSIRNQPAPPKKSGQIRGLAFLVSVILGFSWSLHAVVDWMGDEQRLPLSQIIVQGEMNYIEPYSVRDAVNQLGTLQSFMLQDVNVIQKAISVLPWVSHVAVRKQWPDTIKVNITEYQPAAIWNGNHLLDVTGKVFNGKPTEVDDLSLISLNGPKGSEVLVIDTLRKMQQTLSPTKIQIEELTLTPRRAWQIITLDGVRIELGRESKYERLARFVHLFHKIKATGRAIAYIDLRYDTGAAVGWQEPIAADNSKPRN